MLVEMQDVCSQKVFSTCIYSVFFPAMLFTDIVLKYQSENLHAVFWQEKVMFKVLLRLYDYDPASVHLNTMKDTLLLLDNLVWNHHHIAWIIERDT